MAFEKFAGGKAKGSPDCLSITGSGLINIGADLAKASGIGEGSTIILLWDSASKKIAIAPVAGYECGAYMVKVHRGGIVPHVGGISFLKHIGIDLKRLKNKGQEVKATWNNEEGQIETEPMKGF